MDIEKNNMAHQEKANNKQRKGLMMNFYRFSTSKKLHKPQSKSDSIPSMTNKPASKVHIQHRVDHRRTELQTPVVHDIASPRKSRDFEVAGKGGMGAAASEGRKSVSHVETNVASVAAFLSVKVLAADMPAFMQAHAFRCARSTYDSLEKFSSKHMAFNLKKEFDKVYGPAWHCIVGSNFGSFVTHSTGCFLYFSMEKLYILVFRTKVRRALD